MGKSIKQMTDNEIISKYFSTLWKLDRSDQPALMPDYEEELCKKRDELDKEIGKRKLQNHPYLIELIEASYK